MKNKPAVLKAKNKAASYLGELIETANKRRWEKTKHAGNKDAVYGMYRYDSTFAFPVYNTNGGVVDVRTYDVELLIRNASDGRKYLYDIVNIKQNTAIQVDLQKKETRLAAHKSAAGSGVSTQSVAQSNDKVKHSVSGTENILFEDSNGRKLSQGQVEYFKDSKVRDKNGNLKIMYHGTSRGGFTVFDTFGSNYGLFGQGSYFTDNKEIAQSYTKKGKGKNPQVYESYLNIKNPMDMDAPANPAEWAEAFPDAIFPESGTNEDFYRAMEEYFEDEMYTKWEAAEEAVESIIGMGYDGINLHFRSVGPKTVIWLGYAIASGAHPHRI